uniref:Uncharacterized protein n=2 Tax=Meloidogyne TaxID=189290 RepID=A0A6V7VBD1_MELEN|nr:unnamed protein product [Meloidogyne enterolobii]
MLKYLIILCLIIKTHSWTWNDYPPPRGPDYWRCGVTKPAWICDPDGMLTDQQREEIVELVEDFKEKTKRPNSKFLCMREGVRLVVALAKFKIVPKSVDPQQTYLCRNDRRWTSTDPTKCDSDVVGFELNKNGFKYCQRIRWLININEKDYQKLGEAEKPLVDSENYFDALKNYIEKLRLLYIDRYSIFDNIKPSESHHSSQDTNNTNKKTTEFSTALEENRIKLSQVQQSLDQQNKTLLGLQTDIEENKINLSEIRQLLLRSEISAGKNVTTPLVTGTLFNNL